MENQNLPSSARIKSKLWKTNTKKAKENNGKSGEEPKSSPFYDHFGSILSEKTIFTMPEFEEVGQKSVIASPKFSKSHQNNKEKSQANNTNDSKFFVFPKGHLFKVRYPGVIKRAPVLYRV